MMKNYFSVVTLFSIGIGPSSSHTVGPMRAAAAFACSLQGLGVHRLQTTLFGSLAATGKGHGTDQAIILGFMGEDPATVNVDTIPDRLQSAVEDGTLTLPDGRSVDFRPKRDLRSHRGKALPRHPNGMHFCALNSAGEIVAEDVVYSVGGGFIVRESEWEAIEVRVAAGPEIPFPFHSAGELLAACEHSGLSIAQAVLANENCFRPEVETRARLRDIWQAMQGCVDRGMAATGSLPGGLHVERRAKACHESLLARGDRDTTDPLAILDWVNLFALAVNEENAAGGRVVTAPTNGAAGIIPAVLSYATRFRESPHPDGVHRFLLTAGAIGSLYKRNASISGADVGCQGEVGVACSMAAGGLTEYLGGTPQQVEFAAEIGMEHNLGLTCDPIGGLVQIPCIERNAMGSVKAINASRLALSHGERSHYVSLDKVIETMLVTGRDMKTKYKETSRGGLAVNVVAC
jgi:L-serine dehydratase